MSDRLKRLFTRTVLTESSAFKNIIALNEHDIDFLRNVGLFVYEGFKRDITEEMQLAMSNSSLFEQLQKESQRYLEGTGSVYWNQKVYNEGEDPVGMHVVSVSKQKMKEAKGTLLTKFYDENRVMLYLPVLEDWASYYEKTCNEGMERRLLLQSIYKPLREYRMHKLCLYNSGEEELVEVVKR